MLPLIGMVLAILTAAPPHGDPLSQAGALWESCAKEDADACYRLACLETVRITDDARLASATATFEAGCAAKDMAACFALGMYLDDDGGLPIDGKRAFELFTAACDSGFAPACLRASILYRVSVPSSEPDAPQRASALLLKACDAGLPEACHDLAQAGVVGAAIPVDDATAAKLLDRGCAQGSFQACRRIAERLLPEPPFACDQCTRPDAIERGDEPCIACEIAACRKVNCCPTCEGRLRFMCCAEEFDAPLPYPLKTAVMEPKEAARARAKALAVLTPAVKRLDALCDDGLVTACRDLGDLFSDRRLPFFDQERATVYHDRAAPRQGVEQ